MKGEEGKKRVEERKGIGTGPKGRQISSLSEPEAVQTNGALRTEHYFGTVLYLFP